MTIICFLFCVTDAQYIVSKHGGLFVLIKTLCERKPSARHVLQYINNSFITNPWNILQQAGEDTFSHHTIERTLTMCDKYLIYCFDFIELNSVREGEFIVYANIREYTKNANKTKWSVGNNDNCLIYISKGQMKIGLNLNKTDLCTAQDITTGNYTVVTETLNTYRGNKGILHVTSNIPSVENTTSGSIFSKIHAVYRIL
jgi:hypothetical protein